ncbi:MAG: hypothetical protein ACRYGR_08050 [Janthinobacterium lividum]
MESFAKKSQIKQAITKEMLPTVPFKGYRRREVVFRSRRFLLLRSQRKVLAIGEILQVRTTPSHQMGTLLVGTIAIVMKLDDAGNIKTISPATVPATTRG